MKIFRRVFVYVIIFCMLLSVTSCDLFKSGPEKALSNFEKAFNKRDLEGMIEILPPMYQSAYKMELGLAEGLAGVFGVGDFFSSDMMEGAFGLALGNSYIDIEVLNEEYTTESSANVEILFTFDGEQTTEYISMIEISGDWYIDDESLESIFGDLESSLSEFADSFGDLY